MFEAYFMMTNMVDHVPIITKVTFATGDKVYDKEKSGLANGVPAIIFSNNDIESFSELDRLSHISVIYECLTVNLT